MTSFDVNAYLRNITGADVTVKDFRTWAGTVLAGFALGTAGDFDNERQAKHNLKAAIDVVAKKLGNTAAVCRKCYVHPDVVECYFRGSLAAELANRVGASKSLSPPKRPCWRCSNVAMAGSAPTPIGPQRDRTLRKDRFPLAIECPGMSET